MKLSEYINRLEEIKDVEGDVETVFYKKEIDTYIPLKPIDLNVELVDEVAKLSTKICVDSDLKLALFIG